MSPSRRLVGLLQTIDVGRYVKLYNAKNLIGNSVDQTHWTLFWRLLHEGETSLILERVEHGSWQMRGRAGLSLELCFSMLSFLLRIVGTSCPVSPSQQSPTLPSSFWISVDATVIVVGYGIRAKCLTQLVFLEFWSWPKNPAGLLCVHTHTDFHVGSISLRACYIPCTAEGWKGCR